MALSKIEVEASFGAPLLDPNGDTVLDPAGNRILVPGWSAWTDVLDDPIEIVRGLFDPSPASRVADTGSMKLTLDNSANNSAGLVGYYSPDSENCRQFFANGLQVRINLERVSPYYKFQGSISNIDPEPGLLSRKVTFVEVVDWMDVASRTPMPRLAVQQSQRDDQIIQTVLDALDKAPQDTDLDIASDTYDYALTDIRDESDKVVAALQSLMLSGFGRLYIIGGTSSGEVLKYQTLSSLVEATTPAATFDNSFLSMNAERTAYKRLKRVRTTVYPMEIDSSYQVVYNLPQSIGIGAGETVTIELYFRDTNSGGKNRLAVIDVQDLVVDTDYKFSSSDGSGNDKNSDLDIDAFTAGSNSVYMQLTNSSLAKGYLWFMQIRAKGLYRYDPLTYTAENSDIKESEATTLDLPLPYQSDYNVARDRAIAIQLAYNDETTDVPSIVFNGGQDDLHMDYAVNLEPGALIEAVDDVIGISQYFYEIGYRMTIGALNDIKVELAVVPANLLGSFCKLDYSGRAELDDTAILGY